MPALLWKTTPQWKAPFTFVTMLATTLSLMAFAPLSAAHAADPKVTPEAYEKAVAKAIEYLQTKGQADDGSYNKAVGPALTALITSSILKHGRGPDDPTVAKSLKYLEGFIDKETGGIHQPDSPIKNYETCLAILCFAEANKDGRYDQVLAKADAFIKGLQWGEAEGKAEADFEYGGAGYGRHKRPDLSNTSFFVDALKATGNDGDSDAMKRALLFISRCQNLETEHNTTPFGAKNPDGGFYYTPAAGGSSQAGETPDGGLRSYGSMTYAGLKSMIYAGLKKDDPRAKAAYAWIQKHYDLETNPGMGKSGLYYYYHMFAKALDAMGEDNLVDDKGVKHNWRDELAAELISRQQADGSWVNDDNRWLEGDPNLVTGYALLTLAYCRPNAEEAKK